MFDRVMDGGAAIQDDAYLWFIVALSYAFLQKIDQLFLCSPTKTLPRNGSHSSKWRAHFTPNASSIGMP